MMSIRIPCHVILASLLLFIARSRHVFAYYLLRHAPLNQQLQKHIRRNPTPNTARGVSASIPGDSYSNNNDSERTKDVLDDFLSNVDETHRRTMAQDAIQEEQVAERQLQLYKRFTSEESNRMFRIQLPLAIPMGITLTQITPGRVVSEQQLDLDTMRITSPCDEFAPTVPAMLESNFRGLFVQAVRTDSPAYQSGVRVGDLLVAVSATMGGSVWPTSTLEGVQSALTSRRLTSTTATLQFRRLEDNYEVSDHETAQSSDNTMYDTRVVDNHFELTLTKPLGFQIGQDLDGYVIVTGLHANAPTLVNFAIAVGDRIVAVDSSLGGQLWPVSTVEGVISAVTSRLPGQTVTMRFQRPKDSMGITSTQTGIAVISGTVQESAKEKVAAPVVSFDRSTQQKELLKRCRDVLKRYSVEDDHSARKTALQNMPALVADKVVDALASASTRIDAITLSMIMNAYLSCDQPEAAIHLFEAATGFSGNGSSFLTKRVITGSKGGQIVPTDSALNLYTGSCLMKAHAVLQDFNSVLRILAALEGRSGVVVGDSNLESAPWPWTGPYGSIQPDTICYNIAISAAEHSGGDSAMHRAMELFGRMRDSEVKDGGGPVRNVVTYNTILSAMCNKGHFDEAFNIFDRMKQTGLRPDKFTYTALIKACTHKGDYEELLYDMMEHGVRPDVVTYNTIIQTLCNKREWTKASKLVSTMEAQGISPDSRTYGLLMNGMLKADKASACLTLFESACANSSTVSLTENVHLYTTAITAACVIGDHDRALEYVARMTSKGVKPNVKTLTAVIGSCLSSGKPNLAVQIYNKIDQPDGYAMFQGIRSICESGELSRAAEMIESQVECNRLLSGKQMMLSYKSVLKSSLIEKDYELSRRMFTDLLVNGFIPSKSVLLAIVDALELSNLQATTAPEIDAWAMVDKTRFNFFLFMIDSIQKRNLPVDDILYMAAVTLGSQLGGTPREVASLMVRTKTNSDLGNAKMIFSSISADSVDKNHQIYQWEDLLDNYDRYFPSIAEVTTAQTLPPLVVRISSRDVGRVLRAEQALFHRNRRKKVTK